VAPASVALSSTTYQPTSAESCVTLESNTERLECYDTFFKRPITPIAEQAIVEKIQTEIGIAADQATNEQKPESDSFLAKINPREWLKAAAPYDPTISLLDRRWELSHDAKLGTFHLKAYKPSYILPVFITGNINDLPAT